MHGIDQRQQIRQVRRLAIVHGIDPLLYYKLQLFLIDNQSARWLYILDSDVGAFHRMRDALAGPSEQAPIDRRLLGDKIRVAEHLVSLGLPLPPTLATLRSGSTVGQLPDSAGQVFLCKPRSGSSARGIFRYTKEQDHTQVMTVLGRAVPDDQAAGFVNWRLAQGDYLVQPYVSTHRSLAHLGASADEAVTVRIITERSRIYVAFIEIPTRADSANGYCSLAIDIETGVIQSTGGPNLFVDDDVLPTLVAEASGVQIPDWSRLKEVARAAHASVDSVYAIAWDFVISNSGPILLEGNTGWGVSVPQRINGPLLAQRYAR